MFSLFFMSWERGGTLASLITDCGCGGRLSKLFIGISWLFSPPVYWTVCLCFVSVLEMFGWSTLKCCWPFWIILGRAEFGAMDVLPDSRIPPGVWLWVLIDIPSCRTGVTGSIICCCCVYLRIYWAWKSFINCLCALCWLNWDVISWDVFVGNPSLFIVCIWILCIIDDWLAPFFEEEDSGMLELGLPNVFYDYRAIYCGGPICPARDCLTSVCGVDYTATILSIFGGIGGPIFGFDISYCCYRPRLRFLFSKKAVWD